MAKRRSLCIVEVGEDVPVPKCVENLKPRVNLFTKESSWPVYSDFYLVLSLIGFEVCKQTATFSLHELNNGHYPIPSTLMVVFSELAKLVITVVRLKSKYHTIKCFSLDLLPGFNVNFTHLRIPIIGLYLSCRKDLPFTKFGIQFLQF